MAVVFDDDDDKDRPDLTDEQKEERRKVLDRIQGDFNEDGEIENPGILDELNEGVKPKVADRLLQLVEPEILEVFEDQYNNPHVVVKINGQKQAIPIAVTHHNSGLFKKWICKTYYDTTHTLMTNTDAINAVCNHFSWKASLDSDTKKTLDLRVSYGTDFPFTNNNDDRTIYYDLTNKQGQVVAITKDGWGIKGSNEVPIMFEKSSIHIPQTYPIGSEQYPSDIFDQFMDMINVKDKDRLLLKCYIISLFIPKISKTILMLHGPEGAAKTTAEKLIKFLVDPTSTELLKLRQREDDLILQLAHNYLIYYDNLSEMPGWISDLFCMVATGASFAKRMLYYDDREVVYNITRPIGFNGINLAANRADILDRGLNIELEGIDENRTKLFEEEIRPQFERIKPMILSYIFDIVSKVLEFIHDTKGKGLVLRSRTRMADWEEYCEIIARAMGVGAFQFLDAYRANREKKTEVIMEESPVAQAIVKLMVEDKLKEIANGNGSGSAGYGLSNELFWTGSTTQLYSALKPIASDDLKIDIRQHELWPKAPNILSRRLVRVSSSLKKLGITIEKKHDGQTRSVKIVKIPLVSLVSLVSSDTDKNHAQNASDSTNDIPNDTNDSEKSIVSKNDQNHAQNMTTNGINDTNDIIADSTEKHDQNGNKDQKQEICYDITLLEELNKPTYDDFLVDGVPIWDKEHRMWTKDEAKAFEEACSSRSIR